MPRFNAAQRAAIEAENQNILVSAAAGSGKTTVMVEKIRETLKKHPEASMAEFLVITFTKDAARNMKNKLRDLLERGAQEGDERSAKALGEIETATISTIHSFCTQLLTEYNDNAGATMTPRVLKESQKRQMMNECFADAGESILGPDSARPREERQAVSALMSAFSLEEIGKMVQDLYNALMGIPDPFDLLEKLVDAPPYERRNREILGSIDLELLGLEETLRQEEALMEEKEALDAYAEVTREDAEIVCAFLKDFQETDAPDRKRALLESSRAAFRKAPAPRGLDEETRAWKKRMDDIRDGIKGPKGVLAASAKRLDALLDEKNSRLNAVIQQELRGLAALTRETARQYEQQKLEAGAIDYADMEQISYRIMKDPDKREELLGRYKYIYVDECQDVSGIQDAIIKRLTGPGHQFFMVGDIKQSIYGFRHAEPELFEQERRAYSDDEGADERRIFFMDNYRSCRSVVDAVNAVFAGAMDERITDMNYLPEDHLRCNLEGDFGPIDVILVQKGEEEAERIEAQCEAAARYIRDLIAPAEEMSEGSHYQYRDIVILVRAAKGTADQIVEQLKKAHIPAVYEGVPDFYGLAEVKAFLSLLTVLDNRHNDEALVGTLINTPFQFTESDLAEIRLGEMDDVPFYRAFEKCSARGTEQIDRKCTEAAKQLDAWQRAAENMSVPDFVWWLMRETGIYAARGAYPDGRARQANLDALYQRALDGVAAGHTRLSDFISEIRRERETRQSDSDDLRTMGTGDNFVRVMTMHKSKGLEFPCVILMDLQKSIRRKRNDETLRMDLSSSGDALGLYLPAVRRGRNSRSDSSGKDAFDQRAVRKNISESTRLLYVAMTRAQERLCLIGSFKDGEEELWRNSTRAARIWKTRSMLDMIMPAVLRETDLPETGKTGTAYPWRLTRAEGKAIAEETEAAAGLEDEIGRVLTEGAGVQLYEPEKTESAPLKTSVSTLTRQARPMSEEDSEETVADKRKSEEAVRTFRLSSVPERPAFLEEEKAEAADIGTATHRFMRLIDLDILRENTEETERAVRSEAERMLKAGILTGEEARMIRLKGVAAFFQSGLGRRMLKSAEIRREATFTMKIQHDRSTMVQGIIDCAFLEMGEWILIDYKTDHDTAEETFVPRHEAQMNWYRTALERLTHRPVREMWLYALRAGKAYPVNRFEVI